MADLVTIPPSAVGKGTPYPAWEQVRSTLEQRAEGVYHVPATRIANAAGNPRAVNMVLLGFLSAFLELPRESWEEIMSRRLPPAFVRSSIAAFLGGVAEANAMSSTKGTRDD